MYAQLYVSPPSLKLYITLTFPFTCLEQFLEPSEMLFPGLWSSFGPQIKQLTILILCIFSFVCFFSRQEHVGYTLVGLQGIREWIQHVREHWWESGPRSCGSRAFPTLVKAPVCSSVFPPTASPPAVVLNPRVMMPPQGSFGKVCRHLCHNWGCVEDAVQSVTA